MLLLINNNSNLENPDIPVTHMIYLNAIRVGVTHRIHHFVSSTVSELEQEVFSEE